MQIRVSYTSADCVTKYLKENCVKHEKIHRDTLPTEVSDKELKYSCSEEECSLKFVSEDDLKYHENSVHKEVSISEELYCKLCYVTFRDSSRFGRHKDRVHKSELPLFESNIEHSKLAYYCKTCKEKFISDNALNYHMKENLEEEVDRLEEERKQWEYIDISITSTTLVYDEELMN